MLTTNQACNQTTYNRFHPPNYPPSLSLSSVPPPLDWTQHSTIRQNTGIHGRATTIIAHIGRNPIAQSIKYINYIDKHAINSR